MLNAGKFLRSERSTRFKFEAKFGTKIFQRRGYVAWLADSSSCRPALAAQNLLCKMRGLYWRIDIRSRRKRINAAIFAANLEEHQLAVVLELHAEPVQPVGPAELMRGRIRGPSGQAGDF